MFRSFRETFLCAANCFAAPYLRIRRVWGSTDAICSEVTSTLAQLGGENPTIERVTATFQHTAQNVICNNEIFFTNTGSEQNGSMLYGQKNSATKRKDT